jgi:Ca2+-binding RTX toxin-like protein
MGGDGNDSITTYSGSSTVDGGDGNDQLEIGFQSATSWQTDSVNAKGGAGDDIFSLW